ncbi:MAG: hypothetical protein ACYC9W_06270 [Candidatus Limnocylindria bacterium]
MIRVRKVDGVSTAVRVGSLIRAGDPLGVDWLGREIRERHDIVIVSLDRYQDGWLVSYREGPA